MDLEEFTPTLDPTQEPTQAQPQAPTSTMAITHIEEPTTPTPGRLFQFDMDTESPDVLANSPIKPITRKRPHPPAPETVRTHNFEINYNWESTKQAKIKRNVLAARDLILAASVEAQGLKEQDSLLDLLEVLRDYTEKGRVKHTSTILATQINALERTAKRMDGVAKVSKPVQPALPAIPRAQPPAKASWAAVAAANSNNNNNNNTWTTIERKKKPEKADTRLVLSGITIETTFNPLTVRQQINQAIGLPMVAGVTKTVNNNLVLTTNKGYNTDKLLEHSAKWRPLIHYQSAQKDQNWHKVVVHGVPIQEFEGPEGIQSLKDDIQTFNDCKVLGTPFWLTSREKRQSKYSGTMVIAFETEAEAKRAITSRFYVAGKSVKVEKWNTIPRDTQCSKCQGFGHAQERCKRDAVCRICAASHYTSQHRCPQYNAKDACAHTKPKCANCGESHLADAKQCELRPKSKRSPPIMVN